MHEWAVVGGAAGALGRPIAARLGDRGLNVLAVGRTLESLLDLASENPRVTPCVADLGSDSALACIAGQLSGDVRAVVHVAGSALQGTVGDATTESISAAVNLKVNGMLRMVRAADPYLRRGSRLIAVTGNLGYDPIPDAAIAGIANAAMANLVRQLNRAYEPRGVTCHAVAPGPVDTQRLRTLLAGIALQQQTSEESVLAQMSPSGVTELATPDQVAWAVDLLVDPEAVALAGSTLLLDMGRRTSIP